MNIEQQIKLQIGELAVQLMAATAENTELKAKIAELEAKNTEAIPHSGTI